MRTTIKKYYWVLLLLAGVILGFLIWRSSTFRITGTSPGLSQVPDSIPYMDINFSQKLVGSPSISASPNIIKTTNVKDKRIRINFRAMQAGQLYKITLTNIRSVKGKSLSQDLSFKPKKLAFEKIPQDQQQAIVNAQDPEDPSLVTNDPLVAHLPYGDLGYNINYIITTKDNKPALVVQISVILAEADYKQNPQALQNTINQREQAALAYIRSLGLEPAKYNIQYILPEH